MRPKTRLRTSQLKISSNGSAYGWPSAFMKVILCAGPNAATGTADRGVAELAAVEVEYGIGISGGGLGVVRMGPDSDLE